MKLSTKELNFITKNINDETKKETVYNILSKIEFKKKIKPEDILKKISKFLKLEIRNLNSEELDYVTKDIPKTPCPINKIAEFNRQQIINNIQKNISTMNICISKESIEQLKEYIVDSFYNSSIEAGESAGNIAAMSLGELFTQLTLNTFHSAGQSQKGGDTLEKLNSLFNVSINPNKSNDSTNVHFINKNLNRLEIQSLMRKKIMGVTIDSLVSDKNIINEPVGEEDSWWYENNKILFDSKIDITYPFLRVNFDMYLCFLHGLTLYDIAQKIEQKLKFKCIVSPSNKGIIDMYIIKEVVDNRELFKLIAKSDNMKNKSETYGYILKQLSSSYFDKITINGIKGINDFDIMNEPLVQYVKYFEKLKNIWYIYVDYFSIRLEGFPPEKFIQLFMKFKEIKILEHNFEQRPYYIKVECSKQPSYYVNESIEILNNDIQMNIEEEDYKNLIKNIESLSYYYYNYVICYGKNIVSNLLQHPNIDSRFVLPDNVHQIMEYFGIETTRLYLIRNYIKLINSGKNYINPNNLELLVDFQTSLGKLLAVNSTGVSKQGGSVMSDASFDEPLKYFKKASGMGTLDHLRGISGSILVGKQVLNGTGIVNILYKDKITPNFSKSPISKKQDMGKLFEDNYEVQKFDSRGVSLEEENSSITNVPNIFTRKETIIDNLLLCPKIFIPKPLKIKTPDIFQNLEFDESDILIIPKSQDISSIIIPDVPEYNIGDSLL